MNVNSAVILYFFGWILKLWFYNKRKNSENLGILFLKVKIGKKKILKNWKKSIKFSSVFGGHLIWWNGISLQQIV